MNREERVERYEKWEKWIEDQEKSGLSRKEFCKCHELVLSQFAYYYGAIKAKYSKSREDKKQLFARIQFNKPENNSSEIRLILPNGFQCVIPVDLDATLIKQLMGALLSC